MYIHVYMPNTTSVHVSLSVVNNQLLCVVYERLELVSGLLDPHLWTYRTRITLDHLSLTLQQRGMQECPILQQFLKEVCVCITYVYTCTEYTFQINSLGA